DESYMILYQVGHGHLLYDGRSYARVRDLDIDPPDIEQVYWSTTDPDVLYWIDGNRLMRYRVSTDASEAMHTIDFCSGQVRAESPGWISWDSNVLALECDDNGMSFIYRLDTGTVLGSHAGEDPPLIAPSGTLAYWNGDVVDTGLDTLRTLDLGNTG